MGLGAFATIVPCGIRDAGVTSLSAELGRAIAVDDVRSAVADAVCSALDGVLAVAEHTAAHTTARVTSA
jgi:lipoyl(octanoyl) transferase